MRLGVVDMLPKDFRTCTPAQIQAITALGVANPEAFAELLAPGF